ncbi:phosphotransferase family protein [Sphingomonas sp. SUN019]|uniref:phosphotransferase family protein n=1 Tax=Sphingomonas sp. SUN019 TaxID=2937788 RepID=UPI00216489BA|nr:phosphotransferase family protein [Sphingomonas sp. SUN019]UVO49717.1 phosphotransferase family protein [Sphingomonas sp. SUN019]
MRAVAPDEADRFARWMAREAGISDARMGRLLAGGNANVTRLIESADGAMVLRHAPQQAVSAKAGAGIAREYRLLAAIGDVAPVPRAIAWCDDPAVIGVPFAVSAFVEGVALTDTLPAAYPASADAVDTIGRELVDGIAQVHTIDWQTRLPAGCGRPDDFLTRQIHRWNDLRAEVSVRELPMLDMIARWLLATLPTDGASRIVHCDYHLDNCLFDPARPVLRSIIDWEMATIGDPMVDLGLLLMFWRREDMASLGFHFVQRISNRRDVVDPRVLADRWSDRTGLSSERLDWYRVFAFWRLAAIVEGAFVLYRKGAVDSAYARGLERDVPALLAEAAALIR